MKKKSLPGHDTCKNSSEICPTLLRLRFRFLLILVVVVVVVV